MTFLKNQFNYNLINDNNINISQLLELQLGNLIADDFFKNKIIKRFSLSATTKIKYMNYQEVKFKLYQL